MIGTRSRDWPAARIAASWERITSGALLNDLMTPYGSRLQPSIPYQQ